LRYTIISKDIRNSSGKKQGDLLDSRQSPPLYDPDTHVHELSSNKYFYNLLLIRDIIKRSCDEYMRDKLGATNVDLFMLTTSVSSPMGPGSDSEPLPIKFGDHNAYLTDSSQFGFEPLLMNGFDKLYCYLPSMRGEQPDDRHLNQFFHCEAEISGNLEEMVKIVEEFVSYLAKSLLLSKNLIANTSVNASLTIGALTELAKNDKLHRITFDDACDLLIKNNYKKCVNETDHGRDISSEGEQKLLEIIGTNKPVWIMYFDRDRVPFYQKPDKSDSAKVLCADLIFPPLQKGSFGGEIVGAGQRQDNSAEIYESLKRQNISSKPYEWYIDLRNQPGYKTTSGFGLGIERFIAWSLCLTSIRDAIIYPREKNVLAKP
jgi:asparaginyl-tRNA synthetase